MVENLEDPFVGVGILIRGKLKERLDEAGITIHTGWQLEEITDKGAVCIDKNWQRYEFKADTVVLATGLEAKKELVEKLKPLAPEVYIIGDCLGEERRIYNAFEDAWRTALKI
jgi:prephenate dehydrogenase